MQNIKIIFLFMILFGIHGCMSSGGDYYVLSVASQPQVIYPNKNRIIGVEKITVPGYLYKREIAIAKSSSQITLLGNAVWGEDLDKGLTSRLIGFLQKKFQQPSVYEYPWNFEQQPSVKVKVQITRFIAQGSVVYLDANWEVENMHTHKRKAKLFSTSIPTSNNATSIVSSMDKAFAKLEESIALGIK